MEPGRIGVHGDNAMSPAVLDISLVLAIAPFHQLVEEKLVRVLQRRTRAVQILPVSFQKIYSLYGLK